MNMNKKISSIILILSLSLMMIFTSCQTIKIEKPELSRSILGEGSLNAIQLASFFCDSNPDADFEYMKQFAQYYIDEASAENINSDVAFAQMCLETGYLRFGNLVTPEMHNYCGLGAIDASNRGCEFATEQEGVRAHIQHLQAYATTEDVQLNQELIDPRYNWVHKTKFIQDIEGLTGTWATDPNYSIKLNRILDVMKEYQ